MQNSNLEIRDIVLSAAIKALCKEELERMLTISVDDEDYKQAEIVKEELKTRRI